MPQAWSDQPLEELLKDRLNTLPGTEGEELYGDYTTARRYVIEEVVEYINRAEPNLTDHGPRHLADVMQRTTHLLSLGQNDLTPKELYALCVSILFHDVGNIQGRTDHQMNIGPIYKKLRGSDPRYFGERNAVLAIAGAHTGRTRDGSRDTLKSLDRQTFRGTPIRIRELAAILRLADELAVGEHRTSAYLRSIGGYSFDSRIYHAYAEVVEYSIQGGENGRIAMTFSLDITEQSRELMVQDVKLSDLLELCYRRIIKLDQERRFCKHYCSFLRDLAETGAWFNFFFEGRRLDLDLLPLVLSDLIIPGDPATSPSEIDSRYEIGHLLSRIVPLCAGG